MVSFSRKYTLMIFIFLLYPKPSNETSYMKYKRNDINNQQSNVMYKKIDNDCNYGYMVEMVNVWSKIGCARKCSKAEDCYFYTFDDDICTLHKITANCIIQLYSFQSLLDYHKTKYISFDNITGSQILETGDTFEITNGGIPATGKKSNAIYFSKNQWMELIFPDNKWYGDFSADSTGFTLMFWFKLDDCFKKRDFYTMHGSCNSIGINAYSGGNSILYVKLCAQYNKHYFLKFGIVCGDWLYLAVSWSPEHGLIACLNGQDQKSDPNGINKNVGDEENVKYIGKGLQGGSLFIDEMVFVLEFLDFESMNLAFESFN